MLSGYFRTLKVSQLTFDGFDLVSERPDFLDNHRSIRGIKVDDKIMVVLAFRGRYRV
jgi:hypothetical protein